MKAQAHDPLVAVAVLGAAGLAAFPATAFAQTSSSAGDAAAGAAVTGFFAIWSIVFFIFYAAFWLLFIALFVLWIMAIIDVISRHDWEFPNALQGRPNPNDKMLWVLVVLLAGVIGAVVYYFVVMKPFPLKKVRPPMAPGGVQPPYQQPPAPPQPPAPQQPPAPPYQQPRSPEPPSLHGKTGG
jgi:hypothetical protein